jgi:hypothetical protein
VGYVVVGDKLYTLTSAGDLWRTSDLVTWTKLGSTGVTGPHCLTALDGHLYIGTTDSKLFRSSARGF